MDAIFFETPERFREWLEANHASASELWVGYWKKGTGRPSITWSESVDQALCYGWIDGVRRSLGPESYANRFTPRKPRSYWSTVNIERARALIEAGLMRPAGLAAFEGAAERENRYSFEQQHVRLAPEDERRFRENPTAWSSFQSMPPSYRKTMLWWVATAKRPATRARRLETLISESEAGRRILPMRPRGAE